MLNGHPLSAKLPEDLGFGERFWYWRGHSGQSYIHSIYGRETCPPLAGAIFVAVRNSCGSRMPISVGRFPVSIVGTKFDMALFAPELEAGDEIHVHLLARDVVSADRVQNDLESALREELVPGFAEDLQDLLVAA